MNINKMNFKDWSAEDIATLLVATMFGWKAEQPSEIIPEEENTGSQLVMQLFCCSPEELTRDQLRQVASGMGIPGCWQMNKADLCRAIDQHTPEETDLEVFTVVETRDHEVETWAWTELEVLSKWHLKAQFLPVWSQLDNESAYFTTTGDNPVLEDAPTVNDKLISAAGFQPQEVCDLEDRDTPEHYTLPATATYQGQKRRERHFHAWVAWIWKHKSNQEALRAGWKSFWKKYFTRKKDGTINDWLAAKQIALLRKEFEKLGASAK